MVSVSDLAAYLRLPPDNSEALSGYLDAAVSTLSGADVPQFAHNALYDLAVLAVAAHAYDNRSLAYQGNNPEAAEAAYRRTLNALVWQLRYAKEDPV